MNCYSTSFTGNYENEVKRYKWKHFYELEQLCTFVIEKQCLPHCKYSVNTLDLFINQPVPQRSYGGTTKDYLGNLPLILFLPRIHILSFNLVPPVTHLPFFLYTVCVCVYTQSQIYIPLLTLRWFFLPIIHKVLS